MADETVQQALGLAARGWRVFPCQSKGKNAGSAFLLKLQKGEGPRQDADRPRKNRGDARPAGQSAERHQDSDSQPRGDREERLFPSDLRAAIAPWAGPRRSPGPTCKTPRRKYVSPFSRAAA